MSQETDDVKTFARALLVSGLHKELDKADSFRSHGKVKVVDEGQAYDFLRHSLLRSKAREVGNIYAHHIRPDKEYQDKFLKIFLDEVNKVTLGTIMSGSFVFKWFWKMRFPGFFLAFALMLAIIATLTYLSPPMDTPSFLWRAFSGMLLSQFFFAYSHMMVHALMLEYNLWINDSPRWLLLRMFPTLSWYAFYHHQHTPDCNWGADTLSPLYDHHVGGWQEGQKPKGPLGHQGWLNTIMSHWTSYSMGLVKPTALIYVVLGDMYPNLMPVFAGYEFGMLLCPFNHLHGHQGNVDRSGTWKAYAMNVLDFFYLTLDKTGVIATVQDHKSHHWHEYTYVFQSFTSSGLYSRVFDKFFDTQWNFCFTMVAEGNKMGPGENTASDTARRQDRQDKANPYRIKPFHLLGAMILPQMAASIAATFYICY